MSRKLLIKLLFRLLKIEKHTKDLMLFSDMDRFTDYDKDTLDQVKAGILKKYMIAKAEVYNNSTFIQYLYFMIVQKRAEHITTVDKKKRDVQIATILFITKLIDELKSSDEMYMAMKKRKKESVKKQKIVKSDQDNHVNRAYQEHEKQLQREKAQYEHLNNKK